MLDRGDSLIMYSDGLIERRGEVITHGMERLANTAIVVARAGWPDHPAVTFASMLSVEERTDDVVVLCLSYTGVSEERITDLACGYVTGWHVNAASRTGGGEHARGAPLGGCASARSAGRGDAGAPRS